ncbi:unnamed protein product [Mytilus coruscus]|uniref:Novel STAND NTPase 3 domain-containing protein n=1 Tax=Mytilus coruscus TaxID=42192 RepID=A0A6J8EPU7_MYTCO|nr:unnamed protein product [Mytilus coruscus]
MRRLGVILLHCVQNFKKTGQRNLKRWLKQEPQSSYTKNARHKNIIVITGSTGADESAIAYYAAFRLQKESGYQIIPVIQPVDIINYHVPGTKQVFIIDDFIGKNTIDEKDVGLWEKNGALLNIIFSNDDDTKLILTGRTYVWQPEQYTFFDLSAYTCDLLSDQTKRDEI